MEQAFPSTDTYYRAEVQSVEESKSPAGQTLQQIEVEIRNGEKDGETAQIDHVVPEHGHGDRSFEAGDNVVVVHNHSVGMDAYYMVDHYRLPAIAGVFLVFLLIAVVFARKKAVFAIAGLSLSILILTLFIVPQLAAGANAFVIGVVGAVGIAVASLYISHGFNRRSSLALLGMIITIIIAMVLAWLSVFVVELFGVGSEGAYYVQLGLGDEINLRGVLLVGILIGSLGILDDVTTALVATVGELHEANPSLSAKELYKRGLIVGKEHITSIINTLALAYAGASLPLLLLFSLDSQPFWVTLNSQFLAEEIIRTLIGSAALVLAVPITAVIASRFIQKKKAPSTKTPLATS